jgi:hypothetical protein
LLFFIFRSPGVLLFERPPENPRQEQKKNSKMATTATTTTSPRPEIKQDHDDAARIIAVKFRLDRAAGPEFRRAALPRAAFTVAGLREAASRFLGDDHHAGDEVVMTYVDPDGDAIAFSDNIELAECLRVCGAAVTIIAATTTGDHAETKDDQQRPVHARPFRGGAHAARRPLRNRASDNKFFFEKVLDNKQNVEKLNARNIGGTGNDNNIGAAAAASSSTSTSTTNTGSATANMTTNTTDTATTTTTTTTNATNTVPAAAAMMSRADAAIERRRIRDARLAERAAIREARRQAAAAAAAASGAHGPHGSHGPHGLHGPRAHGRKRFADERARLAKERRLRASFVRDVSLPDGTDVFGRSAYTKVWRLRNDGAEPWKGVRVAYVGGKGNTLGFGSAAVPDAESTEIVDVAVPIIVGDTPGRHVGFFKLVTSTGQRFGPRLWVDVNCVAVSPTPVGPTAIDHRLRSLVPQLEALGFRNRDAIIESLLIVHRFDLHKVAGELRALEAAASASASPRASRVYWLSERALTDEEERARVERCVDARETSRRASDAAEAAEATVVAGLLTAGTEPAQIAAEVARLAEAVRREADPAEFPAAQPAEASPEAAALAAGNGASPPRPQPRRRRVESDTNTNNGGGVGDDGSGSGSGSGSSAVRRRSISPTFAIRGGAEPRAKRGESKIAKAAATTTKAAAAKAAATKVDKAAGASKPEQPQRHRHRRRNSRTNTTTVVGNCVDDSDVTNTNGNNDNNNNNVRPATAIPTSPVSVEATPKKTSGGFRSPNPGRARSKSLTPEERRERQERRAARRAAAIALRTEQRDELHERMRAARRAARQARNANHNNTNTNTNTNTRSAKADNANVAGTVTDLARDSAADDENDGGAWELVE